MMKNKTLLLLGAIALTNSAIMPMQARTWTSADGTKTFNGDFKSYNETTGIVTVIKGFRDVKFKAEMLSEADREWLKSQTAAGKAEQEAKEKAAEAAAKLESQAIGSKIAKGVMSKLEGKKFVDYTMTAVPEYYVVYYSASW